MLKFVISIRAVEKRTVTCLFEQFQISEVVFRQTPKTSSISRPF